MNVWRFFGFGLFAFWLAGGLAATNARATPSAYVHEPECTLAPVLEQDAIAHDFRIENIGSSDLEIVQVKTGCGCITSDYDRRIRPGCTGTISVHVDSSGYGGRTLKKEIVVLTNDPAHKAIKLRLRCRIESFAAIQPNPVILRGVVGETIRCQVRIIPALDHPFRIVAIKTRKTDNIDVTVEGSTKGNTVEYALLVTNLIADAGRYADRITIKTDSDRRPELHIDVYGLIQRRKNG